jgi:Ca2+-binding RTX toxin-like protein
MSALSPTANDDRITGTDDGERLNGLGGNDTIRGIGGDDTLNGGAGEDELNGGAGNDRLFGGKGNDYLADDNGNDTLESGSGYDTLTSGAGNDSLILLHNATAKARNEWVDGGDGHDSLFLHLTANTSHTYDFDFRNFQVINTNFLDILKVEEIDVYANDKADTLRVTLSENGEGVTFRGKGGIDTLFVDASATSGVIDFSFSDSGRLSRATWGSGGKEWYVATSDVEKVHFTGNKTRDLLFGGQKSDTLIGGGGHDELWGDYGNDSLYGGRGADTLKGDLGRDRLFGGNGADDLEGGHGNDTLFGGNGNDRLAGGVHNDRLFGGTGADTLEASYGTDTLTGGGGSDVFLILSLDDLDQAIVADFQAGSDVIQFHADGEFDFDDLAFTQQGNDARITEGNVGYDGYVLVQNTTIAEIDNADHFSFV